MLYAKTGLAGVFGLGLALIAVDFLMRLVVIEKRTANKYFQHQRESERALRDDSDSTLDDEEAQDEERPLLGERSLSDYRLPDKKPWIVQKVTILACMGDIALLSSLWLAFAQALLIGSFDATIPTVAESFYGFDSLRAGLMFLPLGATDLVTGPIAGWSVDKFGTKPITTMGCLWLTPAFILLRIPHPDLVNGEASPQVKIWAGLLAIAGVGMGIFGAPTIVEAGAVVENYYKANPEFFGENGPYAQLYGINSMGFNFGLVIGPLIAGSLKDSIGYGNMNAVMAGIAALSAIISFLFIGGKPRVLKRFFKSKA